MNTAPQQIDRKGVLSFILLAYGLAWLVVSPPGSADRACATCSRCR